MIVCLPPKLIPTWTLLALIIIRIPLACIVDNDNISMKSLF